MRDVYLATLDKVRPCVILTRDSAWSVRDVVTVAGITKTARGLGTEVAVGIGNGIGDESVINCEDIVTISQRNLIRHLGFLSADQEAELKDAIEYAFGLG